MHLIHHDNQLVRWTSWAVVVVVGWIVFAGLMLMLVVLANDLVNDLVDKL